MAWDQLSINKPHLVYIILGGFTSLFMLCSSIIKERLYIGEATVATICGIIFGPHAANLINPFTWGNTDQITLEFSRIVLVVQCFAVGVELPKAYMERHWRSVTFLLIPVMTFGWLMTSLFIWGLMYQHLSWLESLAVAACVTATDPVLASSVVGKGKFAKRVPKHLRDLLSAESGCNDGMAFPFIYLALYIIKYRPHAGEVFYHWVCYTILYECVFGAFYGVCVGYIARRAIRAAHERDIIDRESFLVFYFVLALFCAGSGALLGMDDLLVGFACGVGFSNDGWFTEKTEESHVSNVIDLLINLAFFVYFGTIIPWEQYNSGRLGLDVWKLVVIALLVLFFRRIPIMLALKPVIPDIKTWREALFAGHFGPIGVGAIFVAILARAELETDTTSPLPLSEIPESTPEYNVIYLIWPITTFLVVTSIVVHGSSIAVFTLGKHINTLTLTMSYTQANEQGPSWMDRLPRIQSRSKSMMSTGSDDEKTGVSGFPIGAPGTFLRRQREEENPSRAQSRASSRRRSRKSKNWDNGVRPGGPISQSAIAPMSPREQEQSDWRASDSETLAMRSEAPSDDKFSPDEGDDASPGEIYEEGKDTVFEDEEGNVLAVERSGKKQGSPQHARTERREGQRLMREEHANEINGVGQTQDDSITDPGHEVLGQDEIKEQKLERPGKGWRGGLNKMTSMTGEAIRRRREGMPPKPEQPKESSGPARAYQYGNTIIVEDEDGEVIKKYDIPAPERKASVAADPEHSKLRIGQMSRILGIGPNEGKVKAAPSSDAPIAAADKNRSSPEGDDERLRFTITTGGKRMNKAEFIDQIRHMDPKSRAQVVEESNAPEAVKREARNDVREQADIPAGSLKTERLNVRRRASAHDQANPIASTEGKRTRHPVAALDSHPEDESETNAAAIERVGLHDSNEVHPVDSKARRIPLQDSSLDDPSSSSSTRSAHPEPRHGDGLMSKIRAHHPDGETAAGHRRRIAIERRVADSDSEDDGTERVPPGRRVADDSRSASPYHRHVGDAGETAAERRRREGALGISRQESDSEEEAVGAPQPRGRGIRFADQPEAPSGSRPRQSALKWGQNVGR